MEGELEYFHLSVSIHQLGCSGHLMNGVGAPSCLLALCEFQASPQAVVHSTEPAGPLTHAFAHSPLQHKVALLWAPPSGECTEQMLSAGDCDRP